MLVARGAIDLDCLVYADSLVHGRADLGSLDDVLVVANSLLDDGAAMRGLDGGLGHADVLAVTRLGTSTVPTLDVVNGGEGDGRARFGPVVMVVVAVGVDLNAGIRILGARRSLRVVGARRPGGAKAQSVSGQVQGVATGVVCDAPGPSDAKGLHIRCHWSSRQLAPNPWPCGSRSQLHAAAGSTHSLNRLDRAHSCAVTTGRPAEWTGHRPWHTGGAHGAERGPGAAEEEERKGRAEETDGYWEYLGCCSLSSSR